MVKSNNRIVLFKGYETKENEMTPINESAIIYYICINYQISNYFGDTSGNHHRSKRYVMKEGHLYQQLQFGEVKETKRLTKELKYALNNIK